jgi:hypothetical protein
MADDLLTELRGYTGWPDRLDDLAKQMPSTQALQVAHEASLKTCHMEMQPSSLSSCTIQRGRGHAWV